MPFPVTKTITATGLIKSGMTLNYIIQNGAAFVTWTQGYNFIDANDETVPDLQKHSSVSGKIKATDLESQQPTLYQALVTVWNFLDGEINRQEGL